MLVTQSCSTKVVQDWATKHSTAQHISFPDDANGKESISRFGSPELGRSPGEGNGNPLKYSCLGNPIDRGAWWATVHRGAKSWTWLSNLEHAIGLAKKLVQVFPCYKKPEWNFWPTPYFYKLRWRLAYSKILNNLARNIIYKGSTKNSPSVGHTGNI